MCLPEVPDPAASPDDDGGGLHDTLQLCEAVQ